jgi:alkyldihydroxyacetonephosphate synthase
VDAAVGGEELAGLAARLPPHWIKEMLQPPRVDDLDLGVPRIEPPAALAGICTTEPSARAGHTYGKSYRDVMRALAGDLPNPPDLVAFPRTEADVVDVLDWAGGAGIAVIRYGGGSSVVGGVEYRGGGHPGVVSLDLSGLDQVLEVDAVSRAARIQGGVLGPALVRQFAGHGLTPRHMSELASESLALFRRASSSPRWAGGWPPGPVAITPCAVRISTISWSPFGW